MAEVKKHCRSQHTLLEMLLGSMNQLESDELEPTLLEAGEDGANESTLNTIGLK